MEKNCIIIHGCPSNVEKAIGLKRRTYDKHWIPWIKRELTKKGIKTETPLMPEPWEPVYDKFKNEFEKYSIDEDTILVGHSCGCAFLVRYLSENKLRVNKLILVAPWKIPYGTGEFYQIRRQFYEFNIDETIKNRVREILMFTADDEEKDGKESLKIYRKNLGGKVIELKKHGHYTWDDMKTEKFSELLNEIIKN